MIVLFLVGLSLPASAASGLFLKTPPAAEAFLLRFSGDTTDSRATSYALQGLVNSVSAEVFIDQRTNDRAQIDSSGKPYTVLNTAQVGGSASLRGVRTLFDKYHPSVQKMFLYDPAKDWTFYLALMAGAQQNGIPVTDTVRAALQAQVPGWAGTVVDYRNIGTNRIEGYDWALANLMPNCTKKLVYFARDFDLVCLDYAAASKSFVFDLSLADPAQVAKISEIFATPGYGVGTSLGGYAGDSVNELANPYGIGYNVNNFYSNGSFWSSFPNKTYTQPTGEAVTALNGKVYVAILLSDGDNLQFAQGALYSNWRNDPNRGTVPVGTSMPPVLQEMDTPLLDWYYANKTPNDELVAGPSGFQFIYLNDYDPALLPQWCEINAKWTADAGFHTTSVWRGDFPSANYDVYTALSGVDNIRHNRNLFPLGSNPQFSNGVPVFNERIRDIQNEQEMYDDLAGVTANPSAPVFATVKLITARFGTSIFTSIKTVVDRLNADFPGKYVFQLPSDQAETAREYLQPKRSWNTGSGTWNTTTANWVKRLDGASVADTYTNNVDAVAFEDAAGVTGNPVITLNSALTPKHVSMKSTLRDYTISGSGGIGGDTALILDPANTGTLTLATANTYTGVTAINGGTLRIGNSGTTGSLASTGAITNNAALVFNRSNATTQGTHFGPVISGSGTLANTGSGTLTLSGANTYRGATRISNGFLSLTNSLAMQNSPLDTQNSMAGRLSTTATALTLGGLTGNKNLATMFTAGGGYTGLTALTLNPAGGVTLSYSADIGNGNGGMSLIKTGPGAQILSGTNTHTGPTSIHNGILKSGVDNALPAATALSLGSGATVGGLDLDTFNQNVATLNVNSDSALANTLAIGAGKTLTVTNGATIGFDSAANTTSRLATAGPGTLNITGGNLLVGGSVTTNVGSTATLDMSGLANFTYNNSTGTVRVGDATNAGGGGTGSSTLILADTSTITAATLTTNSPAAQRQYIYLGSVENTINATTINIGPVGGRSTGGTLAFNEATGNLMIRGLTGGSSRANMTVGYGNATTGVTSAFNIVDLTGAGHPANLLLGTLQIAGRTNTSGGGSSTGTFSFENGTLDATGVTVGDRRGTSGNTGLVDGTLNLGGGTVTIGATGLTVASNSSSLAGNSVNGTVNITGGAVNIGNTTTSVTLGSSTNAGAGATIAALNLTGGSLTVTGNIVKGGTTGTVSSALLLSGGSLDMSGKNIGAAGAGAITLTAESGELKNVAAINGSGGLTKTTAGTLVLSGANSYTGATLINGGILGISSDANLGSVPASATPGNIVLDGGTLRTTAAFTIHARRGIAIGASGGRINNAVEGNLIYNGIITGTSGGALTVTHAGSSGGDLAVGTFAAANTYDGATIIDNGHLSVNNLANGGFPSSIGLSSNAAANLVLKNTAILHYQGGAAPAATTDRLFTLGIGDNELRSSGTGGITFGNTGGIAYTDSGIRTLSLRAVTAGATNTLASIIGDGAGGATSLHKHGPGTWRLTGANTYTGETRINSGILALGTGGGLGNGNYAGDIFIGDGASLGSASTLPQILTGIISGAGTLGQSGPADLSLTNANTFTGATTVSSGILNLANSLALQNSPLDTLNSSAGSATTGLKTALTSLTLGGLTGNKNLAGLFTTATGGYTGLATLILNPGSGVTHNYSGDTGNGNGGLNLIKTGPGTQILSGMNTYGGATVIGQGTLAFAAANTSLTGILTFGATAGSTMTGALDLSAGSATFGGLVVQTNSTTNNTITIGAGRTLATNGNVTIGTDTGAGVVTNLTVSGNGSWTITNPAASGSFLIGAATGTTNTNPATLDMSGLETFNANLSGASSVFRLGDSNGATSTPVGSLKLAANSTLTTATLGVSDNSGSGTMRTLSLGTGVNTINANRILIGEDANQRGSGTIDFQDGVNGTLIIRSQSGATSTADLILVDTNNSGGSNQTGRLLLAGHTADVSLNAVVMASRGNGTGSANAEITFDNGSFSANTIAMTGRTGSSLSGTTTGTITIGGGTASLGAVTMAVNTNTNASTGVANATLTINNGSVTATSINMANAGSTGSVKTANGNLNLNGGSLSLTTGNITRSGGSGTENAMITVNGGILNMNGRNIGSGTAAISLVAQAGTLSNLAAINGSGGLTKTTAGTLVLSGTNSYTGATVIDDGTLALGASNAIPATAVSIGNATLNAATFTDVLGTLDVTASAVINLGAGASLAFANSSAIDWSGGTLNLTGTFVSGSSLRFGTTSGGLTSTQLGKISATGLAGFALTSTGYLTAIPDSYASWIAGAFANGQVPPDKRGANDDFDNDGVRNLVEYAIAGQDPTVPNATIGTFNGTTLSFTKRPGTSGLSYAIQKSTDLGMTDAWAEVPAGASYVNDGTTIYYTFTPGTPARSFARLRVIQPP
jgi:autotransporter-associated beta strand protein